MRAIVAASIAHCCMAGRPSAARIRLLLLGRSKLATWYAPLPASLPAMLLRMLRMLLLLLLACAAAAAGARGDPTQAVIDEAHAKSVALRRQLLAAWTFDADASPSSGYYASFAGAPIQHIIAAMALNENQTAVALAQEALANPNMSSHFGSVYEWTCVARAFAMFNSRSGWTASSVATMRASTEESMKNMTFHYAVEMCGTDKFCGGVAPSQGGGSMCTSGSENLDYDAKSSCYISLRELAKFPEYKDRPLGAPPPPPPPPGPHYLKRCQNCCHEGCGLKCCSEPPPAPQKCCCLHRCEKTRFWSHSYTKRIHLPRQARDKHRKTLKRKRVVHSVNTTDKCPLAPPPPPLPKLMSVSEASAEWDR